MKCRIILLDDNKEEFLLLSHIAKKNNINAEIIHFDSYINFEKDLDNISRISCILLDYDMPEINGVDALKLFQNKIKLKYVPIILFSNAVDPTIIEMSKEYGATSYILKPKSNEGLKNLLQSVATIWPNVG